MLLRAFDYLSAVLTGCIAATLVFWFISPSWPMPLGMVVGMVLGVIALLIVLIGLAWFAGAFEIVMPGKFIGMIVGMVGGMRVTLGGTTMTALLTFGVFVGLVLAAIFHTYDRSLHGAQR